MLDTVSDLKVRYDIGSSSTHFPVELFLRPTPFAEILSPSVRGFNSLRGAYTDYLNSINLTEKLDFSEGERLNFIQDVIHEVADKHWLKKILPYNNSPGWPDKEYKTKK